MSGSLILLFASYIQWFFSTPTWLAKIHQNDPHALWLVVADSASSKSLFIAQFLKATGANVLGGVRCMPDHEMVRVLDPENQYATVYNPYAGIYFIAMPDGSPVFELLGPGHYQVRLPMQPHILEGLGVRYLVLADRAEGMSVPGFEQIGAEQGLVVLRRR